MLSVGGVPAKIAGARSACVDLLILPLGDRSEFLSLRPGLKEGVENDKGEKMDVAFVKSLQEAEALMLGEGRSMTTAELRSRWPHKFV